MSGYCQAKLYLARYTLIVVNQNLTKTLKAELRLAYPDRELAWFRYAQKTSTGYHFLPHKEAQYAALTSLALKLAPTHPNLTLGQIVDELSLLVNI